MSHTNALGKGIEVRGGSVLALLKAIGPYAGIGKKIYADARIYSFEEDGWYPIEPYLEIFTVLKERFGEHTLFLIGRQLPDDVIWPPYVKTIEDGLASIDVAYHLNHRINGEVMCNLATGEIKEGMGNYRLVGIEGRRATMVCDTPYPSDFDRGIILTLMRKFRPLAEVTLDLTQPTRKRGAESCTYIVSW